MGSIWTGGRGRPRGERTRPPSGSSSEWLGAQQESLPWFTSRILGFLGYWALTASVIYGLLMSTGILDAIAHRAVSFSLHQELSAIGIGLMAMHGAVLALDTFIQQSVFDLLVPFAGPYRPVWVGIGQLAFYLMVAVYASFYAAQAHRPTRLAAAALHDVPGVRRRDRARADGRH